MEDDLNFKVNGRRRQFVGKWKTTTFLLLMELDLNVFLNVSFMQIKGGLASPSVPELGTAQPQLVSYASFDIK